MASERSCSVTMSSCCVTIPQFFIMLGGASFFIMLGGASKGGLGLKSPLTLIFYKNFITCAKQINRFRIHLLVNLST